IRELKVKVGDAVSEGSVVAMIEAEGAGAADVGAAGAAKPAAEKPAPAKAEPEVRAAETATAVPPAPSPQPSPTSGTGGGSEPPVRFEAAAVMPGSVPYASPAVRLFARELGVDLS